MADGLDNARIARELDLSVKTVQNHVSRVLAKLQARDRVDAVLRFRGERSRVSLRMRMTSTWSSLFFGVPAAVPARTARPASSASIGSDLPLPCRAARWGRLTSMTLLPHPRR